MSGNQQKITSIFPMPEQPMLVSNGRELKGFNICRCLKFGPQAFNYYKLIKLNFIFSNQISTEKQNNFSTL
jgi:hypothetical protein